MQFKLISVNNLWRVAFLISLLIFAFVNGNVLNTLPENSVVEHRQQQQQLEQFIITLQDATYYTAYMMPTSTSTGKNLTSVTWAHAVNSQKLLSEALSADIDMIEADIVLGKLNSSGADLPIMAHPPANSSDLTLSDFLTQIRLHNEQYAERVKGVKLDFKSIEVFEGSLEILDETIPNMSYPIWLNADIISGPVNQTSSVPVDPASFFAGCVRYKQAVLSVGWTTRWREDTPRDGAYTKAQTNEMLEALRSNNILATGQPITFPVRAGIAANSAPELHELVRAVNETNECTLTVWSSDGDYVDVKKLRELIFSFGVERVYLDVPEDLARKLDLGKNGKSATISSLTNFAMVSICFWAFSVWLKQF